MSKGQLMSTKLPPKSSKNPEGVKISGDFSKAIDGVSAAGREDFGTKLLNTTIEMVHFLAKSCTKTADHTSSDSDNWHFLSCLFSIFRFFRYAFN